MALMEIKQLETCYFTPEGTVKAIDGVSLKLEKGHALGLVGESGCGKTTVALSSMKLLPSNAKITGGDIIFDGENLVTKTDDEMNQIRWKKNISGFSRRHERVKPRVQSWRPNSRSHNDTQ